MDLIQVLFISVVNMNNLKQEMKKKHCPDVQFTVFWIT